MSDQSIRAVVVFVGAGNLGSELSKALESSMPVTLVERDQVSTHASEMGRVLIDPSIRPQAVLPYDNLLSAGRCIKGEVSAADGDGVVLADGARLQADDSVRVTEPGNLAPFKSTV